MRIMPSLSVWTALLALAVSTISAPSGRHNVVLIMTDDQDKHLDSLSVMPNVNELIGEKGVRYDRHYCTVALCCPSRASLLTGKAAHNTNVTALTLPYGGWGKFIQEGLNDNWLPVWIHPSASTYYVGKLLNHYDTKKWNNPYPKGWTNSSFLIDPWTYNYHNSTWTNGDEHHDITNFLGEHTTEVTEKKTLDFIDQAADSGEQFFMMVTPVAPHAEMKDWGYSTAPPPAPTEFVGAFKDRKAPRTPNFNPDDPSGASWVYSLAKQTDEQVEALDVFHRHRLRNIARIDLLVKSVVERLQRHKLLDNTYIIYTSDNGFHLGNHRLGAGKKCGFEEDINVPLLIRGPGMPVNITTDITNSHTDIAPTVLSMMGIPLRDDFDGSVIPLTESDITTSTKHEHVNVEFWDSPGSDPWHLDGDVHETGTYYNNTYKSLRINSAGQSFYYSVWCTGEKEFYAMNQDPYQMNNLLRSPPQPHNDLRFFGRPLCELVNRLDALLLVLKSCKQDSCRDPYSDLFPHDQVRNLKDAMEKKFDRFFQDAPKVSFSSCFTGHITMLEGPMTITPYGVAGEAAVAR